MQKTLPILENIDTVRLPQTECDGPASVYLETYGCQMNVSDSEIVASVLRDAGYGLTHDPLEADVVLLNTCAIRENAEQRVRRRLEFFRARKRKHNTNMKIGVLGCMAERLRHKLLEQERLVDIVVGPDAYRDLPRLLHQVDETGQSAVNVQLSREETYADIAPIRYDSNGISAFVSIMRGCDNMCAFCVVPFTRGRERSRNAGTIVRECQELFDSGYREVTLLGQNVNSYRDGPVDFATLLYRVSLLSPELRIRYSTSHPKDCSEALLEVHRDRPNVCNFIHLPVQHGNSGVLHRMRRGYSADEYRALIKRTRRICPGVSLSTDIIAGFCGETEAEHLDTLALLAEIRYDHAFMFMYSERPDTYAARKYTDDVPEEIKKRRLSEIITLQKSISHENNQQEIGRIHTVLVEGPSKRSEAQLCGRTDTNKMVIFDRGTLSAGVYVKVRITGCTSATLFGEVLAG
ncbi:MAG: tRNA (N6-isopentenyl adenosine(37)-C2)-methylthiotransferase MiaB [Rhodothermaceae bacterium]|nr:tRNA (N6-isopentenyl adenosine(37)-C2)-methylthiotransferase MiaB [Rhodothermaceae bacterium]MXX59513.1 tRNA (N6-isopentenyl adenosine(37)-C2)-methylthiotransferase MiaB [Rhodothermaceae bacterium]MYD20205.1 tRNA (N6-isopentenyl adenosine(37)-C2)-methylthiotransferase MiaB [Rhodothermaceae bacterium]MYD56484.1 tRNA (N6-isopentenyl adenosine(37)-C2)-methylthiotransferase MiaB [Rhodothermaceae bacterium]MYI42575.1 tRNA (N6-isopentenyl adenosine(37)-C2)-methylthiotransferase MiaB [Rhodothermace